MKLSASLLVPSIRKTKYLIWKAAQLKLLQNMEQVEKNELMGSVTTATLLHTSARKNCQITEVTLEDVSIYEKCWTLCEPAYFLFKSIGFTIMK